MANKRSSKKDLRRIAKRRVRNTAVKSSLKTYIKKTRVAVKKSDEAAVAPTLAKAISAIDKAAQNGVIHKNQAARRKSRIARAANALKKAAA